MVKSPNICLGLVFGCGFVIINHHSYLVVIYGIFIIFVGGVIGGIGC